MNILKKRGNRLDAVRRFCAEFHVEPDPVLRALGWDARDRCMIEGRVTVEIEDAAETAGTALCALAKRASG
ncbi:MAG: hypothetical protein ACFBQW_04855 [Sphingomonadaceae bacterium]